MQLECFSLCFKLRHFCTQTKPEPLSRPSSLVHWGLFPCCGLKHVILVTKKGLGPPNRQSRCVLFLELCKVTRVTVPGVVQCRKIQFVLTLCPSTITISTSTLTASRTVPTIVFINFYYLSAHRLVTVLILICSRAQQQGTRAWKPRSPQEQRCIQFSLPDHSLKPLQKPLTSLEVTQLGMTFHRHSGSCRKHFAYPSGLLLS